MLRGGNVPGWSGHDGRLRSAGCQMIVPREAGLPRFLPQSKRDPPAMRIAQLSSMTGYYGGEVHLAALATGLRARGHEVSAVVRPGSALAERLAAAGIAVVTLPLVDWYEPLGTARLGAWLRRQRIEILHTHTPRD